MIKKKRKFEWKNIIALIIFLVCFITLIITIIDVIKWKLDSNNTKKQIEKIQEIVEIEEVKETEKIEIIEQEQEIPKFNPYWDYINMNLINVDFNELKKINSSTKGWIQVNGTNINYPFVQSIDNDYYLNHTFNRTINQAGWVFLDYRNDINNLSKNTILYAHGRLDKTMFGSLKNILITYIEEVRDKKRNNDFFEYEFLERIVVEIVNSNYGYDFNEYFDEIKDIVRFLLPEGMNTEEYQSIKNMVVNNLIGSNGLIEKGIFDKNVYASFKSRHDYMFVANLLASIEDIPCSYQDVFDYVCEVGAWMPNQDAFRCEVVACINGLSGVVGSSQEYFTNRIEEAKKRVGVYPVDEKTLALISKEAEKAQSLIVKLDNMQRKVDRFKESIDTSVKTGKKDVADLITQGKKEIGEYSVQSVKEMQESIAAAKTEIISQLDQYLISLENTLKQSSDKVFNQILLDTQEKIRQIRVAAQGLTSATSSELLRIQQASQDSVDKLRNYVENEPALQELLKGVELDEGLKSAILQFSSLSTGAMSGAVVAPTKAGILIPGNDRLVVPANPNVVIPENASNIGILPAFDESIPFDVRVEKILTEKRRREDNKNCTGKRQGSREDSAYE